MDRFWYGFLRGAVPVWMNLIAFVLMSHGLRDGGVLGLAKNIGIGVAVGLIAGVLAGLLVWAVSPRRRFHRAAAPTRITPRPSLLGWTIFLGQCACIAGIIYLLWRMAAPRIGGW